MWPFRARKLVFAYPTSSTFVANVCLGVAVTLTLIGTALHFLAMGFPAFWLMAPAALAYVAAWAMGPGMREEFVVDSEEKAINRRIHTLGFPSDEQVIPREQIRMIGAACPRDVSGAAYGAYVVMVDRRGRWLTFAHRDDVTRAIADRDLIAAALGVPAVEYRCGVDWFPYWGRIQPPPPPEAAKLGVPGSELGGGIPLEPAPSEVKPLEPEPE